MIWHQHFFNTRSNGYTAMTQMIRTSFVTMEWTTQRWGCH